MLALVVVSVGLMALVQSAQTGVKVTTEYQQKTNAYHVADQVMMILYQTPSLKPGKHQGQELMADQDYYWEAELTNTDNARINRIDLKVSLNRDFEYASAQLIGFTKR